MGIFGPTVHLIYSDAACPAASDLTLKVTRAYNTRNFPTNAP